MKFDFIKRLEIGRVGNRDEKAIAAFEQGERVMLAYEFLIDQGNRCVLQFHCREIEERDPEFLACRTGNVSSGQNLVFYQVGNEGFVAFQCFLLGFGCQLFRQKTVHDQALRQATQLRCGAQCYH